jgi:hypothetical protein
VDGSHWTDIARKILEKSPDRVQVLRKFIRQFRLPGWDAPRTAEVQSDLQLLDEVSVYADPELEEFAGKEKTRLLQAIAAAREVGPRFTWTGTKASSKAASDHHQLPISNHLENVETHKNRPFGAANPDTGRFQPMNPSATHALVPPSTRRRSGLLRMLRRPARKFLSLPTIPSLEPSAPRLLVPPEERLHSV